MAYFGQFYLDKEKDIIVKLDLTDDTMSYTLRTPNHNSGNLITNLANLCKLPITFDRDGLKIIQGTLPCYIDANNRKVWILRLANTKAANVYPDGTIERKAEIPAIAKTLMSQTKEYSLSANQTIVKTYIFNDCKFHTDLHTHMNANLTPDTLIALGIVHQLRYPLYYVKKLGLKITEEQKELLNKRRKETEQKFIDSELQGKYKERRINDNTFINFADLILHPIDQETCTLNLAKIRASLAVMKDGQAVFTNLEKVYLYRYVFTKGIPAYDLIDLENVEEIPDDDIIHMIKRMFKDHGKPVYTNNTLYQDELLWIARTYASHGITYAEISDTSLVKKNEAAKVLSQIHEVMPVITRETGVTLRFLAAMRRIPLTIVKDQIEKTNYFQENLQVLKAIACDPYVAGSDFVGEEINDIRELKPVIQSVVAITKNVPSFTIRIHAGENDSLPDNVANSILCVEDALEPGQNFPHMRIGHGLYTANLKSKKGKTLIEDILAHDVVLEFQITSNVRLNNLNSLEHHPLKQYLHAGISCVQGTDGGALYGTDSIDEQLSLERMLNLTHEEMKQMRQAEDRIRIRSLQEFQEKYQTFETMRNNQTVQQFLQNRINQETKGSLNIEPAIRKYSSEQELTIKQLPKNKIPIVIVGGSFNNTSHTTKLRKEETEFIQELLTKGNPDKMFFVIGPSLKGYEKYLLEQNHGRYEIYSFVPATITRNECSRLQKQNLCYRPAIESSPMGVYKSIAYEIFKQRQSIIIAFDGNSTAANLIQEAKNNKYKSRTFISIHSRPLKTKAKALEGYVTYFGKDNNCTEVLNYMEKYYAALSDPNAQILKKKH